MELHELLIFIVVSFILYLLISMKKPPDFPPGPSWYPYIGCLLQMKKLTKALGEQHKALEELSKKYESNVVGIKLGQEYVIYVRSYPLVKKVLLSNEYNGRSKNFFNQLRSMGTGEGITSNDGKSWKIQRSFTITHLRKLGFGRNYMEELIHEKSQEILKSLKQNTNNSHLGFLFAPAVLNISWNLTAGCQFPLDNQNLKKLFDLLNKRSNAFDMSGGLLAHFPWLRFIMPQKSGYNLIQNLNSDLKEILMKAIREHEKNWYEDRDDDLIYSFISEMKKNNRNDWTFTVEQLMMICFDIFLASYQITSHTLEFAFMMMILRPDIQEKVHECLDNADFYMNETVKYSDRHKLSYVEAFLLEVGRMYTMVPLSAPRRVTRDTTLENYKIPKNATVLIGYYSVFHDKDYWKDPEIFRPERFLDENGKFVPSNRVLTFGLGGRKCIGEVLAKSCVFIFFVEILRRYKTILTPGTKIEEKQRAGITLLPNQFSVSFISRS